MRTGLKNNSQIKETILKKSSRTLKVFYSVTGKLLFLFLRVIVFLSKCSTHMIIQHQMMPETLKWCQKVTHSSLKS